MTQPLIDPKAHKQLFLDDHAVERTYAIERTLHQPDRKGAVLRRDRAMGQVRVASWSVPIWNPDKDLWEWWYNGHYGETDAYFNHYATSTDGVHWEKPPLGLYEWQGSKDNNIALDPEGKVGELDSQRGLGMYHILRDDRDPDPGRRYKGLFGAKDRYLGVSPDGFEWTMLDVPPIPSQDTSKFFYDPYTEQFVATVKQPTQWGRSVWVATSRDFDHFTEPRLVLHSDETDWENCRRRVREVVDNPAYITPPIVDDEDYIAEVYLMPVMPYEGLYVGFPNLFNPFGAIPAPHMNFTRTNQPELTVSRDLYNWDRVADRALFMPIHPWDGVAYDTSQISICGAPIVRDDEIWIYYNGYRMPGYKHLHEIYDRNRELFRLNVDPAVFEDIGAMNLAKAAARRLRIPGRRRGRQGGDEAVHVARRAALRQRGREMGRAEGGGPGRGQQRARRTRRPSPRAGAAGGVRPRQLPHPARLRQGNRHPRHRRPHPGGGALGHRRPAGVRSPGPPAVHDAPGAVILVLTGVRG